MAIYFVSDLHFGHTNILKYEPKYRNYNSIKEMNINLIKEWNELITKNDIVYNLGDFFFGCSVEQAEIILKQLNFKKMILIIGNHDNKVMLKLFKKYNIELKYADMINSHGYHLYLSHYPTLIEAKKTFNLHGHIHSNKMETKYHINMCYDYNGKIGISLDELIKIISDIK